MYVKLDSDLRRLIERCGNSWKRLFQYPTFGRYIRESFVLNHRIDTVVDSADRIIVNSDLVNKVGTCFTVVVAMKIKISFNELALVSSTDLNMECGQDIYIHNMDVEEYFHNEHHIQYQLYLIELRAYL